jgi:hypothetical protein
MMSSSSSSSTSSCAIAGVCIENIIAAVSVSIDAPAENDLRCFFAMMRLPSARPPADALFIDMESERHFVREGKAARREFSASHLWRGCYHAIVQ